MEFSLFTLQNIIQYNFHTTLVTYVTVAMSRNRVKNRLHLQNKRNTKCLKNNKLNIHCGRFGMRARCTVKRLTMTMRSIFFKDSNLEISNYILNKFIQRKNILPSYPSSKNFYLRRHLPVPFRTTTDSVTLICTISLKPHITLHYSVGHGTVRERDCSLVECSLSLYITELCAGGYVD